MQVRYYKIYFFVDSNQFYLISFDGRLMIMLVIIW